MRAKEAQGKRPRAGVYVVKLKLLDGPKDWGK